MGDQGEVTETETDTEEENKEEEEDEGENVAEPEKPEEGERKTTMGDINVTDSQVMIQLREAEEEAEEIRKEVAKIRAEIEDYESREELTEEDAENLSEKQAILIQKLDELEKLTKKIAYLMELAERRRPETDIVEEEEEEEEDGFPDDILPRVVVCSSWDDMMPKIVVCVDMKRKPKPQDGERDESGLTPEQREALEKERRCMAEEREKLQYQVATLEGEMRVMMRENEMLGRKLAQTKQDLAIANTPFEFQMTVSSTQKPGVGPPKEGDMEFGIGVMGPGKATCGAGENGNYEMGAKFGPGAEVVGKMRVGNGGGGGGPGGGACIPGCPPGGGAPPMGYAPPGGYGGHPAVPFHGQNAGNLPCGGPCGIPGANAPCPSMANGGGTGPQAGMMGGGGMGGMGVAPDGRKCRKHFLAQYAASTAPGARPGAFPPPGMSPAMAPPGMPMAGMMPGMPPPGMMPGMPPQGMMPGMNGIIPPGGPGMPMCKKEMMDAQMHALANKRSPLDVTFKMSMGNVPGGYGGSPRPSGAYPGPNGGGTDGVRGASVIEQQLREIECEVKRMQQDLERARRDKETLKSQQQMLNCAKNDITRM